MMEPPRFGELIQLLTVSDKDILARIEFRYIGTLRTAYGFSLYGRPSEAPLSCYATTPRARGGG